MHYRFLALDLDGTLTNSRKVITEGTKAVLKKYQECGGTVILASGRPAYGILPLAETLATPSMPSSFSIMAGRS